jgi:hydroxymethylbilane synthase
MLPAVGQGALGIEIHKDNKEVHEILRVLHDESTYAAVIAERTLLKELEGGCQVPIGAYAIASGSGLYLDAIVGSVDGTITFRKRMRGSKKNPAALGKKLAKDLLKAGADKVLAEIYKQSREELKVT